MIHKVENNRLTVIFLVTSRERILMPELFFAHVLYQSSFWTILNWMTQKNSGFIDFFLNFGQFWLF